MKIHRIGKKIRLLYVVAPDGLPQAEFRIYHHDPEAFDLYEIGAPVFVGWNARDLKIFKATA